MTAVRAAYQPNIIAIVIGLAELPFTLLTINCMRSVTALNLCESL